MLRPLTDRPLVYLAGPYSSNPAHNTRRAVLLADSLMARLPVTVFVPQLTMLWDTISPHLVEWWYEYDLATLARCDALLRMPGASTGADREMDFAREHQIPVFEEHVKFEAWVWRVTTEDGW